MLVVLICLACRLVVLSVWKAAMPMATSQLYRSLHPRYLLCILICCGLISELRLRSVSSRFGIGPRTRPLNPVLSFIACCRIPAPR
jgi:hypothetical protein